MSGSITRVILSGASCRLAFEKRMLAAFRRASSKATGVGGGAGAGAVCASADTEESTDPQTRAERRMHRPAVLVRGAVKSAICVLLRLGFSGPILSNHGLFTSL